MGLFIRTDYRVSCLLREVVNLALAEPIFKSSLKCTQLGVDADAIRTGYSHCKPCLGKDCKTTALTGFVHAALSAWNADFGDPQS